MSHGAMTSGAHARILETLEARGLAVRREGDGQAHACCPAHEDREPSLSVGTGKDGRVLLHCHRGCTAEDVLAALDLDWPDLFDGDPPKPYSLAGLRRAGAILERDGRVRVGGVRYLPGAGPDEVKTLADRGTQRGPTPDPATVHGPELWVVEGEADLLSAATIGLPAVALPGAAKWRNEWAAHIAATRERVVIVCDSDQAGREAADRWAAAIAEHCPDVRILDLHPELDDGSDLSTFLADAATEEDRRGALVLLRELADATPPSAAIPTAGDEAPSTWAPVDLADIVAGHQPGTEPTLLRRVDGLALLYRSKLHLLSGEPESAKGWLALHASVERLEAGEHVLYLDFEDSPASIVGRLQALGVPDDAILARFHYLRPDEPLDERGGTLLDRICREPTLAIVDGLTEALTIHGLSLESNTEVAQWLALLPRRLARHGSAVLLIDHVVKDKEARGRYAIGAQHKLAGVDVAYSITVLEPFGRGRSGRSRLTVKKDRPGHLRQHGDHNGHLAHLEMESRDDGTVHARLIAPALLDGSPPAFRPTVLMERLSREIETAPGLSKNSLRQAVKGKNEAKDLALELLIAEQYVRVEVDGQARRHHSERPFREAEDANRAPVPQPCPTRAPGTGEEDRAPVPLPIGGTGTGHGHPGTPRTTDHAPHVSEVAA